MCWIMEVLACLLGFHFLLHHSCKFVALSILICLHIQGFVVKEEIGLRSLGMSGGSMLRMLAVNLMNRYLAG